MEKRRGMVIVLYKNARYRSVTIAVNRIHKVGTGNPVKFTKNATFE